MIMFLPPICASLHPFANSYAIKLLLDALVRSDLSLDYEQIILPIIFCLVAHIGIDMVWHIGQIASWKSLPYVRRSLLSEVYDYVQHNSYHYFQNNFTGTITSKIKDILNGYDKLWAEMQRGIGLTCLKILVNTSVLIALSTRLGLFVYGWSIIFLIVMFHFSKKLDRLAFAESESHHTLIGKISDNIMNIVTIFAFSSQKSELKSIKKYVSNIFIPQQIALYKYDFKIQCISTILYSIKFTFVLLYTTHLRMQGFISIGDFVFVLGITLVLSEDMWKIAISLQDILREIGDLKSAFSILYQNQNRDYIPIVQPLDIPITSPKIEFKHVYFNYPTGEVVFQDLNLTIEAGEKIGIVGYSGSGKSSIFNLLMRYFNCQEGHIIVQDQDINLFTQESLRKQISIVPQEPILFHRSILDNLRYGNPEATEAEIIEACKKAHIHEIIMRLPDQYLTDTGERGLKLSGGQRQRITIARAILKDAPILLLDEATSALDSQTESLIQQSLDIFMKNDKKTVIAIAHRLSTLKNVDRIIVIENGAILQQGTHEQLLKNSPLYRQFWNIQEHATLNIGINTESYEHMDVEIN